MSCNFKATHINNIKYLICTILKQSVVEMRFNLYQHLKSVLLSLFLLACISEPNHSYAARLNANGGYDIVIGVEDNTVEPLPTANQFLDEIRVGIDAFSNELWKATERRFFINSVDVLVPGNWWTVNDTAPIATWQTLLESDIRITSEIPTPNVVNPNACGTSGSYLEIPDDFFKSINGGKFGPVGKALVNMWARYRFGVWEEHGIPGDIKFPYFYAHPSFEPRWEATGCSSSELEGIFQTIDGEESDRCDPYRGKSPDDDCRFIPSSVNTANSSLLHYHWLDSVVSFCDRKSHNYASPNRQNLLCSHRSVWEVIRESEDYKSTETCMESVNRPTFRVIKESKSPEFYLLIDRGRTVTPQKVLQEIMGAMVTFMSQPSLNRINVAVGTYPHANQGRNHHYVKEEIGWAPISDVIYDVEKALADSAEPDGPVIRDFGLAIQEVAEQIKLRNHQSGTVILVIKRGAGPNTFDKLTYEQEVIASINEDNRIKVFAIETQQGDDTPYTNLQSLVEATSGKYHLINDTMNTARKMEWLLMEIQAILEQSIIFRTKSSTWVTHKQYTRPDEEIKIPIYDDTTMLKVHLTTSRQMMGSSINLKSDDESLELIPRVEKGEWDENSDLTRRVVHTYNIENPKQGSELTLSHGCHSENPEDCRFFLLVTAETDKVALRDMDVLTFNSKSISIEVSTSAENNFLDMSNLGVKLVPFAIYAKIEMQRQRILGLENVKALIRLGGEHDAHIKDWEIPLTDDGLGLPDVSENDGIYSAVFTPPEDGLYHIFVTASGISEEEGSNFQMIRTVQHAGGLMPIDQLSFGCKNSSKPRCSSAVPTGSFSRVVDIPATVCVENAATFKLGKPMRILDFSVTTLPNYVVEFEFTSPRLLGSDASPDQFWIYMAPHIDNFIDSTDLTRVLIKQIGSPSGSKVTIRYSALSPAIPYYAVEAFYEGQKGGPSNIVGVVTTDSDPIVPSPTTTTSTPPTTIPTTTEYTWPTTTDYPTTTESEEADETEPASTFSTIEPPSSTQEPSTSTGSSSSSEASSSSTEPTPSTTPSSSTSNYEDGIVADFPQDLSLSTTAMPITSTTDNLELIAEMDMPSTPTPDELLLTSERSVDTFTTERSGQGMTSATKGYDHASTNSLLSAESFTESSVIDESISNGLSSTTSSPIQLAYAIDPITGFRTTTEISNQVGDDEISASGMDLDNDDALTTSKPSVGVIDDDNPVATTEASLLISESSISPSEMTTENSKPDVEFTSESVPPLDAIQNGESTTEPSSSNSIEENLSTPVPPVLDSIEPTTITSAAPGNSDSTSDPDTSSTTENSYSAPVLVWSATEADASTTEISDIATNVIDSRNEASPTTETLSSTTPDETITSIESNATTDASKVSTTLEDILQSTTEITPVDNLDHIEDTTITNENSYSTPNEDISIDSTTEAEPSLILISLSSTTTASPTSGTSASAESSTAGLFMSTTTSETSPDSSSSLIDASTANSSTPSPITHLIEVLSSSPATPIDVPPTLPSFIPTSLPSGENNDGNAPSAVQPSSSCFKFTMSEPLFSLLLLINLYFQIQR